MKKTLSLLFLIQLIFANVYSQNLVDIGWNYDGNTATVTSPKSNTYLTSLSNTIFKGTNKEMTVTGTGLTCLLKNDDGGIYVGKSVKRIEYISMSNNDYIEMSLTQNSANRELLSVTVNGTSSSLTSAGFGAILFSDKIPFDETSVVGYNNYDIAILRQGNSGSTISNIPVGVKSFRLYRKVVLSGIGIYTINGPGEQFSVGSEKQNPRIGYFSATLNTVAGVDDLKNFKTVISTSYYNLMGRKLESGEIRQFKGVLIKSEKYSDGTSLRTKIISDNTIL